jgi:fused signal recognition particle receptor
MIKWFRRDPPQNVQVLPEASPDVGFFSRLKQSLIKTQKQVGSGIARLLLGKKEIDDTLLEALETILISADIGVSTSLALIESLKEGLTRRTLADGDAVFAFLKQKLEAMLTPFVIPLVPETSDGSPFVILMAGVNGAGKTTTMGKLAKQYQDNGYQVMLAAGDTFRAAATEQLQAWGEKLKIPVIAQAPGADSASVIYDAFQSAKAKGVDILIADTAGRLHTQTNLMEELKKVKRVLQRLDPAAPHEVMLVLDASIGQNAVNQARQFNDAIGLTGLTMTKLDGTAKGGILFAIAHELGIPFRYLGIGEGVDDLRPFEAREFVEAIFNDDNV